MKCAAVADSWKFKISTLHGAEKPILYGSRPQVKLKIIVEHEKTLFRSLSIRKINKLLLFLLSTIAAFRRKEEKFKQKSKSTFHSTLSCLVYRLWELSFRGTVFITAYKLMLCSIKVMANGILLRIALKLASATLWKYFLENMKCR